MPMRVPILRAAALAAPLLLPIATGAQSPAVFEEMIRLSQKEGHGLIFYVDGQQIPGVVIAPPHDGVVEVRNQQHDRIVIRLDSIAAIAGR